MVWVFLIPWVTPELILDRCSHALAGSVVKKNSQSEVQKEETFFQMNSLQTQETQTLVEMGSTLL